MLTSTVPFFIEFFLKMVQPYYRTLREMYLTARDMRISCADRTVLGMYIFY